MNNERIKDGRTLFSGRPKKKVIQLSLIGEYITEYESIRDAERETGTACSSIVQCCRNIRWSAGGYRWKYREDGK